MRRPQVPPDCWPHSRSTEPVATSTLRPCGFRLRLLDRVCADGSPSPVRPRLHRLPPGKIVRSVVALCAYAVRPGLCSR
ncbi:hypothetical protein AAFF_G00185200 [Aldrovandia affinis]|uniref:Uncharacterized protein n=1 Tax=Aldrovandia affinis TaxID=143900 RepID=A0AAD7RMJ2_9TELE|nr:hypothetical protein AAFF_G00185200 [Aldrovandia affinis]